MTAAFNQIFNAAFDKLSNQDFADNDNELIYFYSKITKDEHFIHVYLLTSIKMILVDL